MRSKTMPDLPPRKVGIVACSGEELPEGTLTRLAALKVLGILRPTQTVTICLPLFLAGGEGDRAFAKFYPTIALDGCDKRCAARATELYSHKPAAGMLVDEILDQHALPHPQSCRRLSRMDRAAVDAVADALAAEVDRLMTARWSRSEGIVLELTEAEPAVSTNGCACGSGIPVTTVQISGQAIQLMALEPLLERAYQQGLRATGELPPTLMSAVRVYNQIPEGQDALYEQAVDLAWQAFCTERQEAAHG
jgi:hypothetical protein